MAPGYLVSRNNSPCCNAHQPDRKKPFVQVGEWVSCKKLLLVFPPLASPRIIFLQERARILFGDRFASIEPGRGARSRTVLKSGADYCEPCRSSPGQKRT